MLLGLHHVPLVSLSTGLTLVSAPHLARSFHHLFPLDTFQESPLEEHTGERSALPLARSKSLIWGLIGLYFLHCTCSLCMLRLLV